MSTFPTGSKNGTETQISNILADDTRRGILKFLQRQEQSMSIESIARRVSSLPSDHTEETTSAESMQKIKTELHHIHLPKLAEIGLVTYDENTGMVAATDHPLYNDLPTETNLSGSKDGSPLRATLENHLRREVLVIMSSERGPVSRDELAKTIASRKAAGESIDAPVSELSAKLHHIHLPKLEELGLVTYDHVEGTISSQSSPEHQHEL